MEATNQSTSLRHRNVGTRPYLRVVCGIKEVPTSLQTPFILRSSSTTYAQAQRYRHRVFTVKMRLPIIISTLLTSAAALVARQGGSLCAQGDDIGGIEPEEVCCKFKFRGADLGCQKGTYTHKPFVVFVPLLFFFILPTYVL
jgi:hypothetical protein